MTSLSEILKQDAEEMYRVTGHLFDLVDDVSWKPSNDNNWMTTGQLLRHCAESCGSGVKGFVTGDWGMPDGTNLEDIPEDQMIPPAEAMPTVGSVDEARRLMAEDRELCLRILSEVGDERLLNEKSAPPWGGPEKTLLQHCNEMIWHLGVHKAQLFYYLKLQGKPVNTMDLWMGMSTPA